MNVIQMHLTIIEELGNLRTFSFITIIQAESLLTSLLRIETLLTSFFWHMPSFTKFKNER